MQASETPSPRGVIYLDIASKNAWIASMMSPMSGSSKEKRSHVFHKNIAMHLLLLCFDSIWLCLPEDEHWVEEQLIVGCKWVSWETLCKSFNIKHRCDHSFKQFSTEERIWCDNSEEIKHKIIKMSQKSPVEGSCDTLRHRIYILWDRYCTLKYTTDDSAMFA